MVSISRPVLLAAVLAAAPLTLAFAQQNNPAGNMGSNTSVTATPGTADSKALSGMNTADAGAMARRPGSAATNAYVPGATGKTVVPGSTSSPAAAAAGTAETKSGGGGGQK
jgi:hypothetical protein